MNPQEHIPRLYHRFFKWICQGKLYDELVGDLQEAFEENYHLHGRAHAIKIYKREVRNMIRFSVIKKPRLKVFQNPSGMLFNYLITTIRNANRQLGYFLINFFGLTLGLTCCALVTLFVKHELSYDNFHPDSEKIYRMVGMHNYADTWFTGISTAYSDELIAGRIPGLSKIVRLQGGPPKIAEYQGKKFTENNIYRVEAGSEIFDLFGFEMITGNPSQALKELHSVVMTSSTANRYFGDDDPMGQLIKYDTMVLKVTGILEDLPSNSHLDFDLIFSENYFIQEWNRASKVYLRVEDYVNIAEVEEEIRSFELGVDHYDVLSEIHLEPIEDIHLYSEVVFDYKPRGNLDTLQIFVIIAFFILIISCSNYINLSAAIYSIRNIEIGMRKVLGGTKSNLRSQFLFESMFIALATLPFVLLLVELLLPHYNNFLGIELENWLLDTASYSLLLLVIAMLTGVMAGSYPALVLSRIHVLELLQKKGTTSMGGLKLRRILITIQFTLLMILGIGTYFINKQLHFVNNRDIGIQKEGVVKIQRAYYLDGVERIKAFKTELLSKPYILAVSQGNVPGDRDYPSDYQPEGKALRKDALYTVTDFDYFDLLEIEGVAGPYFLESTNEHPRLSLLVNEAFVQNLGWDNSEAIGKRVITNPGDSILRYRTIRGVFRDFNFFSLHQNVSPYMVYVRKDRAEIWENVLIKIDLNNMQAALPWIEQTWGKFQPDSPFMMEFIDDDLQEAYENDKKIAILSTALALAAIALAILGLVGLSAYITELQVRQIGIRKVLGASINSILYNLNREYLWLILVSTIIASLTSAFFVQQWLNSFAYRVELDIYIFPLAGLSTLAITFITVSYQTIKAANANPVEALKIQ